jgi:adenine deaminase
MTTPSKESLVAGAGAEPADVVIKNVRLLDVITGA